MKNIYKKINYFKKKTRLLTIIQCIIKLSKILKA
jgi:hypothetical protein